MVAADLTGSNNPTGYGFVWYAAAIGGVGALGAINELRTLSHYLLALILIVLLLNNRGVFAQFTQALQGLPAASGSPQSGASTAESSQPGAYPTAKQHGIGVDWTAPFKNLGNMFKNFLGGTSQ
jgi:hypothetical protein